MSFLSFLSFWHKVNFVINRFLGHLFFHFFILSFRVFSCFFYSIFEWGLFEFFVFFVFSCLFCLFSFNIWIEYGRTFFNESFFVFLVFPEFSRDPRGDFKVNQSESEKSSYCCRFTVSSCWITIFFHFRSNNDHAKVAFHDFKFQIWEWNR